MAVLQQLVHRNCNNTQRSKRSTVDMLCRGYLSKHRDSITSTSN